MCLKRLKGLTKVHLVDAGFLWTEPHSNRLKVKLRIQKEVRCMTLKLSMGNPKEGEGWSIGI